MDEKRLEKTNFDSLFCASEGHDHVSVMCFDVHIPSTSRSATACYKNGKTFIHTSPVLPPPPPLHFPPTEVQLLCVDGRVQQSLGRHVDV